MARGFTKHHTMTDPVSPDDDWNDLARELGVDKSAQPAGRDVQVEAVEPYHSAEEEAVAGGDTDAATDEEFEDAEDGTAAEAGEGGADGDPSGTGRKRRRRRRRRKKGAPGEAVANAAEAGDESESDDEEAGTEEYEPAAVAASDDSTGDDDFDAYAEADADPLAAVDDTATEALRDLIATWNVPSWDEIVTGLHRSN